MDDAEFIEIELRLESAETQAIDKIVAMGVLGKTPGDVINHMLRQYLFELEYRASR